MRLLIKFGFILLCTIGITTSTFGQLQTKRIETEQFQKKNYDAHFKYVEMDFNSADMKNSLSTIKAEDVESISLVYTMYKQSERFNQLALNTNRINLLLKTYPKFKNEDIKWYWVAQTGCNSTVSCDDFFHGFEIRLKSKKATTAASASTQLLDYYMDYYTGDADGTKIDSLITTGETPLKKICDTVVKERIYYSRFGAMEGVRHNSEKLFLEQLKAYKIKPEAQVVIFTDNRNRLTSVEGIEPDQAKHFEAILKRFYRFRPSRFEGNRVATRYDLNFQHGSSKLNKSLTSTVTPIDSSGNAFTNFVDRKVVTHTAACRYVDTSISAVYGHAPDNVVTEVFNRNPQWQNCLVATDVTGSMHPYLAQFLLWHEKNLDKRKGNHDFVFFNDGDNLPDDLKKVGQVGGTYYSQTADFTSLKLKLTTAMSAGNGSDQPENNIEAILFGLEKNQDCKEVILIADNWATPRDMALLKKIKVPVHVILCGGTALNMDYVKIARETKGSIHTIEQDLYNLDQIVFTKSGKWVKAVTN